MIHKVIITKKQDDINFFLENGWLVKSVTAQYVTGVEFNNVVGGYFCFVLEKGNAL